MTTLAEHVTWSTYEDLLKIHVGVTGTAEDIQLEFWLEAAAERGDEYLDREFDADNLPVDVPKNAALGCLFYVKALRAASLIDSNIIEKKTASLTRKFANAHDKKFQSAALRAARPYWDPYMLDPTLAGELD